MHSIPLSDDVEESAIKNALEEQISLHHPCIAAPIGFVIPIKSGSWKELKIFRFYFEGCSLSEVLSAHPTWWTSTVKAKTIVGIVFALRFAHSIGLFHGHLTTNNILFDCNHCIQIVDFTPVGLKVCESIRREIGRAHV